MAFVLSAKTSNSRKFDGIPPKCTGKITLVFLLIFFFTDSGSRHSVTGSISAKITFPPLYIAACAVLTNDNEGIITSFPVTFATDSAKCSAAVPLLTDTQALAPTYSWNFFSNNETYFEPAPDAQ